MRKSPIKITPKVGTPKKRMPRDPEELLYYGFHACKALFKNRKDDIVRLYCTKDRVDELGAVLKWCASHKKAYHIVEKEDLERVTSSVHHEGVAILAKRKKSLTEAELLAQLKKQRQPLVVLDAVLNPHNIGSIMRVMAHFGWKHLLCSEKDMIQLSSSAARMSEGGSELVDFTFFKDASAFLKSLKALGYQTVATSSHAKKSIYETEIKYPACAFFLGNEVTGLSDFFLKKLDVSLAIPHASSLQSLNVGIAAALFMGECVRKHGVNN